MISEKTLFVAFDTETTGLSAGEGRVVEIAALKFDINGQILDRFAELVKPDIAIPESAQRIHGITDNEVAACEGINIILPRFLEFITGDNIILIAQNAVFDIGFINHEALRHKIELPEGVIWDQISLTRRIFPRLGSYGLESVCRRFNLVDNQSHRAMADSVLVMKLFLHCLKEVGDRGKFLEILESLERYRFGGPMVSEPDAELMETISRAIESGTTMEIIYAGGSERDKPRPIIPVLFFIKNGVGYLTAKCLRSNIHKQFRLDRIKQGRLINELLKLWFICIP